MPPSAEKYRKQAEDCRRAAAKRNPPTPYLVHLAAEYDELAAEIDLQTAGNKPGTLLAGM